MLTSAVAFWGGGSARAAWDQSWKPSTGPAARPWHASTWPGHVRSGTESCFLIGGHPSSSNVDIYHSWPVMKTAMENNYTGSCLSTSKRRNNTLAPLPFAQERKQRVFTKTIFVAEIPAKKSAEYFPFESFMLCLGRKMTSVTCQCSMLDILWCSDVGC